MTAPGSADPSSINDLPTDDRSTDPVPTVDDLSAFLAAQRWFAGKSRAWQIAGVTNLGWLRNEPPAVRIVLVTIAYDDGDTETYQLPLVHHDHPVDTLAHVLVGRGETADGRPVFAYDALHDKEATQLWWHGIEASSSGDGWEFHRDPTASALPEGGPSLVVSAEQSNTSLVFGATAIMKTFRKVSPGLNPDIEIHTALASKGSPHIATPLGWLQGRWHQPDGATPDRATPGRATPDSDTPDSDEDATASLAMVQVFLRDATEGWELAKTSVRDLYAEADLHADEVGGDFAGESARLGAATAEVHVALAEALPSGTLDAKQRGALADGMRERLDRAAVEVEALAPYVDALRAAFDDVRDLDADVPVQRVHGDYHLGQVMRTLDGWRLLDFEGEPARGLEERRGLDSPLKDVAGMLRSFDYAARQLLADHPGDLQREYRATEWAVRNRDAFCRGYAEASGHDPRNERVLLRAYETDKAIYEVVYEARNRPTWLGIPMSAIRRLAGNS
jgi:maltokinase